MKKINLAIFVFILFCGQTSAQTTWEKLFSKVSTDVFRSVQEVPSGGYVAAGYTADSSVNDTDAFVVRLGLNGDTLWTFTYNGPLSRKDLIYKIINTSDNGFITCGYTTSVTGLSDDFLYIKLSSTGQLQWVKTFGGSGKERAQEIVETVDGYTLAGYTTSPPAQYYDVLVVHTDFNGDTLWTKIIGGAGYDDANSIKLLADGGYILGGQSNTNISNYDNFVIRLDASGDTLWTRLLGTAGTDNIECVLVVPDGYVFAGSTNTIATGDDGYMFKTDTSGNLLWSKVYGGANPDDFHKVFPTSDGGFILSGTTNSSGMPQPNMWMVRTNATGDTIWTRTYGGDNHDHGYSAVQTSDGGFIFVGYTSSFGFYNEEAYVVKTDPSGHVIRHFFYVTAIDVTSPICAGPGSLVKAVIRNYSHDSLLNPSFTAQITGGITQTVTGTYNGILNPLDVDTVLFSPPVNTSGGGSFTFFVFANDTNDVYPQRSEITKTLNLTPCVGIEELDPAPGFTLYPNPASDRFILDFSESYSDAVVSLFNSGGAVVKQFLLSQTGGVKKSIDISTLSPGIYLCKVSADGKYGVRKVIVN